MKRLSAEEFACRVAKVKPDVKIITPYTNARNKVKVCCLSCNNEVSWFVEPKILADKNSKCPHKSKKFMDNKTYISIIKEIDPNIKTTKSYRKAREKTEHYCKPCSCSYKNKWSVLPQHFTSYRAGCPHQHKIRKTNTLNSYDKIAARNGLTRLEPYVDCHTKLLYECKCGHKEYRIPRTFKNHAPKPKMCSICAIRLLKRRYSQIAVAWINEISLKENLFIQHAENIGEYHLPGTKFFVDGFCKNNNTVYEFHGDIFHGNIEVYKLTHKPNPWSDKTTIELYIDTKERERYIKSLGYKLITIWESDYRRLRA